MGYGIENGRQIGRGARGGQGAWHIWARIWQRGLAGCGGGCGGAAGGGAGRGARGGEVARVVGRFFGGGGGAGGGGGEWGAVLVQKLQGVVCGEEGVVELLADVVVVAGEH